MNLKKFIVSPCGTHHLVDGIPAYNRRFDECLSMHEPGVAAVRDSSGSFHISSYGEDFYDRRFLRTFGYYEGKAAVISADGAHHIDIHGDDLYTQRYAWVGNFQEGLCAVKDHRGNYYHIDAEGIKAYDDLYAYVGDFKNDVGVVYKKDGTGYFIDREGRPVYDDLTFSDAGQFHKGFATLNDGTGWRHFSKGGFGSFHNMYDMCEPFYNGLARVKTFNGLFKTLGEDGEENLLHPTICHLDDYEIQWTEEIHRNSRGAIYPVVNEGRDMIMKSNVSINLYRNEVKSLIRLNGLKNFPIISDYFISGSFGYIIMEKIPGNTLRDNLEKRPFGEEESLLILLNVLDAVAAIHSRGIAHLDIHPGNIMLSDVRQGEVSLLDFEHSLPLEALESKQEVNWGKWEYVSPEMMMPFGKIDVGADVYSCACLYLNMRTGGRPIWMPRPEEVKTSVEIREEILQSKNNIVDIIPKDCSFPDLIRLMLSHKPMDRPSAEEAFERLKDIFPKGC